MQHVTISHPVFTLDKKLLLSPGEELSMETMQNIIASNGTSSYRPRRLLRYGTVKEDLLVFFNKPPYKTIFSDRSEVSELFDIMETVELIPPCLQTLDYFKDHDFYTYRHILLVFALSTLLARDLIPDQSRLPHLAATGPTHDIGKTCVPVSVLKKTTPLTLHERSMVEHHVIAGYVLLAYYRRDPEHIVARVARDHHERMDGSGYPEGVSFSNKMVEIIAVTDVYDAMVAPRPYRTLSYDNRTALEEITAMAERNQIGWDVVKALVAHNRSDKPHFSECVVSEEKRGTPPPNNVYGQIVRGKKEKTMSPCL